MTVSLLYIVVPTILVLAVLICYMNSCNKKILKELGELKDQLEKMDNVTASLEPVAELQSVVEQEEESSEKTETVLVGLPGHPAAAMLVFELMVIWLYRQLTGQKEAPKTLARISENVAGGAGRTTCLLLELTEGEDGIYMAEPVLGKSGLMTTLTRADGYTLIHGDKEGLKEGELIQVTLF